MFRVVLVLLWLCCDTKAIENVTSYDGSTETSTTYSKSEENNVSITCKQVTSTNTSTINREKCTFTNDTKRSQVVDKTTLPSPIDYVGYVVVPLFLVLGICGNTVTIIVMQSKMFRYMTVSVILTALSISDTTLIVLLPFNKAFVRKLLGLDVRALSESGCKAFFCFFRSAKMTSSWFVVFISLERFFAVWFPLKIKVISTKKNAYIAIACVHITIYSLNGVWTFSSILKNGVCIPNVSIPGKEKLTEGFLLAGTTIYSIIPTFILLVLTPLTILKLYRQQKTREILAQSVHARNDTAKTTLMLLGVSIAYVFLVGPITIAHSVAFFREENIFESRDPEVVTFREASQVMEQLNYAINFFLYVICSKSFRDRCKYVLKYSCTRCGRHETNATGHMTPAYLTNPNVGQHPLSRSSQGTNLSNT
ncbi:allatostatin-A receptor-like [Mizuhopecten yessoensis]|uniref:allatostatin-A receptor-like n=1 Tax=Mizuhopecten yessoensis TaxID=6573 RepID=UPI000B45820F|nr:allatostatin-A receptor-like [Mizuhopecten yessoensis]